VLEIVQQRQRAAQPLAEARQRRERGERVGLPIVRRSLMPGLTIAEVG
jgi:hypothetical protein